MKIVITLDYTSLEDNLFRVISSHYRGLLYSFGPKSLCFPNIFWKAWLLISGTPENGACFQNDTKYLFSFNWVSYVVV